MSSQGANCVIIPVTAQTKYGARGQSPLANLEYAEHPRFAAFREWLIENVATINTAFQEIYAQSTF